MGISIQLQDDRDEHDGQIDKDTTDSLDHDTNEFDPIEQQSDPVYDYQLDIDCDEPITIDELPMTVNSVDNMPGNISIVFKFLLFCFLIIW